MLQYDWIKIILTIVAAIVVWELIFTTTGVRLTEGQYFKAYYYPTLSTGGSDDLYDFLDKKAGLSYDVLQKGVETLDNTYAKTILGLRLSVGEGDIILIDNVPTASEDESKKDDPNYDTSNFYQMVDGYSMYDFDKLLTDAKGYLAELDTNEKIEANFKKRMKRDNRFRKKSAYEAGLKDEIARIEKLRTEVDKFEKLLTDYRDTELFFKYRKYQYSKYVLGESEQYDAAYEKETVKIYGLNAAFLDREENRGDKPSITDLMNISGKSDGVAVMAFDFKSKQPDLQYEVISFMNALIENYSTLING